MKCKQSGTSERLANPFIVGLSVILLFGAGKQCEGAESDRVRFEQTGLQPVFAEFGGAEINVVASPTEAQPFARMPPVQPDLSI
jgi:hypothetical protein